MATKGSGALGWAVAGVLLLALIGRCGPSPSPVRPDAEEVQALAPAAAASAPREPIRRQYVQTRRLNCRTGPGTGHGVVTGFQQNERVDVLEDAGGWSLIAFGPPCWVLSAHLGWTEPPAAREAPVAAYGFAAPVAPRRFNGGGAYANCAAARAAGAAPVYAGEPGYSRRLDRDGDGVGCE